MRTFTGARSLFFLAGALGCGEVQSAPDDVVEPDGGVDVDAPTGPQLVASSPADGAQTIEILSAITLDFDGAIDVDGPVLFEGSSLRPFPADLDWDADALRLTVTPRRPLELGRVYRVEVGAATVRFTTRVNHVLATRSLDHGVVTQRTEYDLGDHGFPDRAVYFAAGPDGDLDTADDVVASYYRYVWTDGAITSYENVAGPGPDGDWFTGDDTLAGYQLTELGAAGALTTITCNAAGADGDWHTDDDGCPLWYGFSYDEVHRLVGATTWSGLGPDGERFTADDVVALWSTTTRAGTEVTTTTYDGDDVVQGSEVVVHDDLGARLESRSFDEDGVPYYNVRYVRDELGRHVGLVWYVGPGDDGVWFTTDDQASQYADFDFVGGFRTAGVVIDDQRNLVGDITYDTER